METFNNRMTLDRAEGTFLRQDQLRRLESVRGGWLLATDLRLTQCIAIPLHSKDRRILPKRFDGRHISKLIAESFAAGLSVLVRNAMATSPAEMCGVPIRKGDRYQ